MTGSVLYLPLMFFMAVAASAFPDFWKKRKGGSIVFHLMTTLSFWIGFLFVIGLYNEITGDPAPLSGLKGLLWLAFGYVPLIIGFVLRRWLDCRLEKAGNTAGSRA
ncbi:hypothetical protein [Pseudomonas putida]|uniref:Uncharacterized protein n=1 Tax=Pseudomonas putida TaxID=303 RepID=A0A8I1EDF4_PSEPU|nr:hypothetical protein [Pseudomonas putida]MBI6883234.1 hypothetical protein [Pseudomonas putida]